MAKPIVIINCKTYPQATGARAVALAKLCERVAKAHGVDIRIAVQATDIALVSRAVKIPVYAEHVDAKEAGKTTGWITVDAIKAAGAKGALLNHAEHRLTTKELCATTALLKKARLDAIVCAENVMRLRELDGVLAATLFCVEPPELIGGDVSVSVAQPAVVSGAVKATRRPLLVGAGVKDHKDFSLALKLGAKGVLLSSGIILAKDQNRAFRALIAP